LERLEYDPNRTSHLALVLYKDGERRYILAPKGVKAGDEIRSGADAPIKPGNALPLRHIPVGSIVHNIEAQSRQGRPLVRSAGGSAQFAAREGVYASVRSEVGRNAPRSTSIAAPPSARWAMTSTTCAYSARPVRCRWLGVRPTVRGVVINPVDHPHGGGEGKSGQGNPHL